MAREIGAEPRVALRAAALPGAAMDRDDAGNIDGIGGQEEAIAWLQGEKKIAPDLAVVTRFPTPDKGWGIGKWLGSEARSAVGLNPEGPLALDGLVSLWQVAQ